MPLRAVVLVVWALSVTVVVWRRGVPFEREQVVAICLTGLVAAGVGVTLVPESVCQLRPAGVRYVRIHGQAPVAMLWLVAQRRTTASGLDNFLRHAEKYVKGSHRRTT